MRVLLLGSFVTLLVLGCSSEHDSTEKRLASLSEDISHLQAENDRLVDRVDALETKSAAAPSANPATSSAAPVTTEHAPLKVVKLVPANGPLAGGDADSMEVPADERPDAPGNRPVIRLRGNAKDSSDDGRVSPSSRLARQNNTESSQ